jgi:hypothetical protein
MLAVDDRGIESPKADANKRRYQFKLIQQTDAHCMVSGNVTEAQSCDCLQTQNASQCAGTFSLRKEVIQPQVLLRLPCYDFTPIMNYTLGGCSSCELAHRLLVQPTFVM